MDVRTNYNSNCPACISIQALIGKEKLETDPANTYWGGGAYQKEVEHLQMGVWPCSHCEGRGVNCMACIGTGMVFLHAPLLIGGVHENLLGRATSLLHDYNQNGNCNILELGQDEECYECGGTGERDCYNCDGGTTDCYRCDGTGEIEDEKGEDEVCSDCDGTGEEVCSDCEGENWCVECGGSGEFWNENLISGIKETYQDAIDYIYANANDSQVRTALNQLVQGLESGQLRTTSGSEMYNEANKKLYNDLHDALIYYVINTPNRPVPAEDESFSAETFAADCCRECGRKEGPYADTVLIGCPNCPELTCQHCYDETNQSCEFCVKKQAENIPNGLVVKNFKTTSKIYYNQNLVRQFKGSRHREEADSVAKVYFRRLSLNPNYFNYRFRAETLNAEFISINNPPKYSHNYVENLEQELKRCYEEIDFLKNHVIDEDFYWIATCKPDAGGECIIGIKGVEELMRLVKEGIVEIPDYSHATDELLLLQGCDCGITHEEWLESRVDIWDFDAETFESEGKPTTIQVKRSTNDEKKLMAVFTYPDGKTKTTHFGQRGASDYTKHGEKKRMELYLERHAGNAPSYTTSSREDWKDPTTAGALSRWILWNKPSLSASFNDFKKRFNLNGDLKVKKSSETFEDKVQYIIFNTKQSRQMPTHIIKVMDERLDFKTLCGMYIKGKGWNNAGVPAKISSKDNPSGLCYKCVEKKSETFSTEYNSRELDEEYSEDNRKMQEAAEKIIELLGKPDYTNSRREIYSSLGESYTSDMVYVLEYDVLTNEGSSMGQRMARKLKQQGTEPWSVDRWTGSPDWPTYAAGPFHQERETFTITVSEANPVVESIVMDLYLYFADKYGVNGTGFEPTFSVAMDEEGNEVTADNLEIDNTWRDSVFESEETFGANNIGSLNYPSLLMFNYWNSKLPRLTYEEYVNANNLGYGLEKLLEINSVPERCEHKNTEPDDVFIFEDDWQPWPGEVTQYYHVELMWQCPDCTRVGSASADYETEGEFWGTDPHMYDVFWEDKTRIIPFRGDHPDNYRELPSTNENSWSSVFGAETFEAEVEGEEVPRYVFHATPQKYWEEIQQQGGMIPQIGYMTYRAFLPRYKDDRFENGLDITPEDYKEWLKTEIGGPKIWATSQSKSSMYGSMIEPMSLLENNAILQIDTTGLKFKYYNYEEYFTNDPIPLSSIKLIYFMTGERFGEEYPDYLLFELSPEYDESLEDDEELADWMRDENYERFLRAAEEGKQNARYSDDIRKVVTEYRADTWE